jgi:hypothetical protein
MSEMIFRPSDADGYGLSGDLWKNFPTHEILGLHDRNVGIGFFEDFIGWCPTTLYNKWVILTGTGCTIAEIADVANAFGAVAMSIDGNAANDEAVMAFGGGLCAPFKITGKDLCFECRLKVSAITAAKWAWFLGLSEIAAGTTDHLFVDTTGVMADYNHLGFAHLYAEGGAVDGAFKADGQTYQDGATKTKLNALKTMVADTYVKLGLRFDSSLKILRWYVDGVEVTAAKLTASEIDAATFPDDCFLTPVIGIKDIAGDTALVLTVDWIACAQEV